MKISYYHPVFDNCQKYSQEYILNELNLIISENIFHWRNCSNLQFEDLSFEYRKNAFIFTVFKDYLFLNKWVYFSKQFFRNKNIYFIKLNNVDLEKILYFLNTLIRKNYDIQNDYRKNGLLEMSKFLEKNIEDLVSISKIVKNEMSDQINYENKITQKLIDNYINII